MNGKGRPAGRPTADTLAKAVSRKDNTARPPFSEAASLALLEAHRRSKAVVAVLAAADVRRTPLDPALIGSLSRLAASGAVWSARAVELAEAS